jgi:hypothetical protein
VSATGRAAIGKHCCRCGQYLPPAAFGLARSRGDGLQPWCRACHSRYNAQRYARQKREEGRAMTTRLVEESWLLELAGALGGEHGDCGDG